MTSHPLPSTNSRKRAIGLLVLTAILGLVSACGGNTTSDGIRLASVQAAYETFENPPQDLVVLDVRTPEEFNEGHLEGAIMVDFYEPDFADQLATLDRDVPYLLYCRSGNRSGQASTIMQELGFTDVVDVDGGITAWYEAGRPVVTE